jgi:LacI family transcriptional regulator
VIEIVDDCPMRTRFPNHRRPATIADVAVLAGVSKSTVSKYLSTTDYYVSEEVQARIQAAVEELGYFPNVVARSLSSRRSYAVGAVVASIANPFYPELIAGAEDVLARSGYTLLLGSSNNDPKIESDVVQSMIGRQVDGVIMASVTMRDREVEKLADSGVAVVLASRNLKKLMVDTVVVDDELGGYLAAQHLLSHGYDSVAHLTGPLNTLPFRQRREGFLRAMSDAGVVVQEVMIRSTPSDQVRSEAAALDLLKTLKPRALFAGSDGIAVGAILASAKLGLRIPQDLAIVGFDNIWVGGIPGVSLTTIDGQTRVIGRNAADLLTQRIEARWSNAEAPSEPQLVVLQPRLITRTSCGCQAGGETKGNQYL